MQFDPEVAKEIGVEEAIMYANIVFWCAKNAANDKHHHDGYYWSYNSISAFTALFQFWSVQQIRRILENLEKKGYILSGNYNAHKYDQTKWYSCPKEQIHLLKPANGFVESGKPIPDIKPDSKQISAIKSRNSEDEERKIEEVDSDTGEARPVKPAKMVKDRSLGMDRTAIRVRNRFIDLCKKKIGVSVILSKVGYVIALRALNRGKLTEAQIYDLFDEWFSMGKPDEETVSITRALSDNQINGYKARNQIN